MWTLQYHTAILAMFTSLRRLKGIIISEKNETVIFHYKFNLLLLLVVTLSYGTKIIKKINLCWPQMTF